MTRIEKSLWVSVVLLVGCVVVLACIILFRLTGTSEVGSKQQEGIDESTQGEESASGSSRVIAKLGNETITEGQLQEALASKYGILMLQDLLKSKAVAKEAEALGIEVTDGEVDQEQQRLMAGYEDETSYYQMMMNEMGYTREELRQDTYQTLLLEKLMAFYANISDADVKDYMRQHPELFESIEKLDISQIVVDTKEDAQDILAKLADKEDFGTLAEEYSIDSYSADQGGALGYIDRNDPFIDKNILTSASKLDVGRIDGPIRIQQGYAIILLNGRQEAKSMSKSESQFIARKQIALAKGQSMQDVEQDLLHKYGAEVVDTQYQMH
ncbi:hypothetical protein BVG16_29890 [Paenibacillus selenitireducens]|uniref:peptidylprolyl isomerase n=1 Tax=Paenibacillus selenitireducens TaxID=1324314 RepID=A0A1T2WZV6_9BACL|nr:peptidylprolyl isomerase [Paenibacillus selenitireducens]OPA73164.1 hypothetical protein BVG16_29890 [Paenibacillus selenitireducens]